MGSRNRVENSELRCRSAALRLAHQQRTQGVEANRQYIHDVEQVLRLQGAEVTRDGEVLTLVPHKGHDHPFNRLAAALADVGQAKLVFDGTARGLAWATKDQPQRLFLSAEDVRAGQVTPNTRGGARRLLDEGRSDLGTRSLWKSEFIRLSDASETVPQGASPSHVVQVASALNHMAAFIRKEDRSPSPLSPEAWRNAAAIRRDLKYLVQTYLPRLITVAEFNLKDINSGQKANSFVNVLGREGPVARTNLSGMQVISFPGGVGLTQQALMDSARDALAAAQRSAGELITAGERILSIQEPRLLAAETANFVHTLHDMERSFAYGDGTMGFAKPRLSEAHVTSHPLAQDNSLETLRASYDFALGFLNEDPEAVLAQAEKLLMAQGIGYQRKGDVFEILPGDGHVLNQQAQQLANGNLGLHYEPAYLQRQGINGEFGTAPAGSTHPKRVLTSHQSIIEGRIDATLRHELDHVRVAQVHAAGAESLWSGSMRTLDNKPFDSSRPVGIHYGKAMAFDEVLGNAQTARTLAAEAQGLFETEGPASSRAYELAAKAVYRLCLVADLATNVSLVSNDVASSAKPVALGFIGTHGATASAQSERFKVSRALGAVRATQDGLTAAMNESVRMLGEEATNIARLARQASTRRDIREISSLAEALYERINLGVASLR